MVGEGSPFGKTGGPRGELDVCWIVWAYFHAFFKGKILIPFRVPNNFLIFILNKHNFIS